MNQLRFFGRISLTLLTLTLIWLALTPPASAQSTDATQLNLSNEREPTALYTVNSSADTSGLSCASDTVCTLRSAIERANAEPANSIPFIFFDDSVTQINLQSALPILTHVDTTIFNSSENFIIINGGGTVGSGFVVEASNVSIYRLRMTGFFNNFIYVNAQTSAGTRIAGMSLEGECDAAESPSGATGIQVRGYSPGNSTLNTFIVGNVICGMEFGIYVNGGSRVRIGQDRDLSEGGDNINIIFENFYGIHGLAACGVTSSGSILTNNEQNGVWLQNTQECTNIFDDDFVTNNGGIGMLMSGPAGQASFRPKEVHSNGSIGIDLGGDGLNFNDGSADADSGPNDLYNSPELSVAAGDPPNIISIFAYSSDGHDAFQIYLYEAVGGSTSLPGSGGKLIDVLFVPPPDPFINIVKIDTNDYPELTTGYITAIAFRLGDFVTSEMSSRQSVPLAPTAVAMQQNAAVTSQPAVVLLLAAVMVGVTWGFGRKHARLFFTENGQ